MRCTQCTRPQAQDGSLPNVGEGAATDSEFQSQRLGLIEHILSYISPWSIRVSGTTALWVAFTFHVVACATICFLVINSRLQPGTTMMLYVFSNMISAAIILYNLEGGKMCLGAAKNFVVIVWHQDWWMVVKVVTIFAGVGLSGATVVGFLTCEEANWSE